MKQPGKRAILNAIARVNPPYACEVTEDTLTFDDGRETHGYRITMYGPKNAVWATTAHPCYDFVVRFGDGCRDSTLYCDKTDEAIEYMMRYV